MVPLAAVLDGEGGERAAGHHAVQHVPGGGGERERRARDEHRRRHRRCWRSSPSSKLPDRMAYEWTELMFLEKQSRNTGRDSVFGLSVAFVFLVLAALYESWAFPLAVILVVPVCVACSLAAVWLTDPGSVRRVAACSGTPTRASPAWLKPATGGYDGRRLARRPRRSRRLNRQVLGGRHRQAGHEHLHAGRVRGADRAGVQERHPDRRVRQGRPATPGADLRTAVLDACTLRFRPIMMTSVAFMLGRAAAGGGPRGRGRDAAGAGRGGARRDDRRDRCSASS